MTQVQHWYDTTGRRVAKSERVGGAIQRWLYLSDGWEIVSVMNGNRQIVEMFTRGVGLAGGHWHAGGGDAGGIAERLRIGTATHLAHLPYGHRRERKSDDTIN